MATRREILQWATALVSLPAFSRAQGAVAAAGKPLNILFLGGTGFLGPHQVEYALARGHRVTLFNRGKSGPSLYGDRVEVLLGDRDANTAPGLAALAGTRRWDVVIDNSGYVPRHVKDSVELLKERCGRYLYVSTVAVYDPTSGAKFDEKAPLRPAPTPATEKVSGESYGPLKAECDRIVQAALGARATIVRPTYIVGPGDETDRFTYWPVRLSRGGKVLVPPLADPVRLIDARDLAEWTIRVVEQRTLGAFNGVGPAAELRMGRMLDEIQKGIGSRAELGEASAAFLQDNKVSAWGDLPVWVPGQGETAGFHRRSNARAVVAGLTFRPVPVTAADTLAWWNAQDEKRRVLRAGLKPERETELLAKLKG